MTLILNFSNCTAPATTDLIGVFNNDNRPKIAGSWSICNEIKPATLYVYLYARFGKPNGIQNILRNDHSDNLIHWEWTIKHPLGFISIMGLNLRTEVHFMGNWDFSACSKDQLIDFIKSDLSNFGKEMKDVRNTFLEHWNMFANPYYTIDSALKQLEKDLIALNLDLNKEINNPTLGPGTEEWFKKHWSPLAENYARASGLAMGIRTMSPILIESFINLIAHLLCRPDIKNDERLYSNFIRSNIDIKIKSLHIYCKGFTKPIDWSASESRNYNSIINERNDLLHGNFNIQQNTFGDIFFNGNVPVFKQYESMWAQSIARSIKSSGIKQASEWLSVVRAFQEFVISHLDKPVAEQISYVISKRDLGHNKATGRVGVLLPDHIVDFSMTSIL